jgi:hypothetical protein
MLSPAAQQGAIVAVFAVVYLGMFLGGLPRLKLDRSGVALLGAIAVIAVTGQSVADAARAVADLARRSGVVIGWRQHAVIGVPVTLLTLATVVLWLH